MKYPQLVSTRAVNAISDWLVSQLEQLGVEAPLIYSRLLLSLLHTSVQINDPIEFSNVETYLAHRKGNKRNPPCDTDTLKKLTAVQCLMEAVSSEQEITKIENLVDELCKKLNEIENNQDDEIKLMEDIRPSKSSQSPKLKTNELDDPRKRYYRAFPALSKEMEDSVWITKRNIKALTWPNDTNTFITSTTIISNATPNVVNSLTNNTAGVKNKSKRRRNQAMSKGKTGGNIRKNSYSGNTSSPTCWDTDFEGSWEMGRDLIKEFMMKQNSHRNRSTSESGAYNINRSSNVNNFEKRMKPSIMTKPPVEVEDEVGAAAAAASAVTTEEGIGERAIAAAATEENENYEIYNFYDPSDERNIKIQQDISNTMKTKKMDSLNLEISLNDDISITSDASSTTTLQKHEISVSDNAFTLHNDDTCSKFDNSKDTLMVDGILNSMACRLYERDISSNDSLNQQCCSLSSTSTTSTSSTTEQNDFAQFKAKFNSSIEALWKNNSNNNNDNEISSLGAVGIVQSSVTAVSSTTSSSLKHKNLENFWTNYYNHHYDVERFDDASTDTCTVTAVSGASGAANVFDNDGVDETDFFSMPLNFDATKIDKFNLKKLSGDNYTSTGVFLQNSIWSDRVEGGSFYGNPLQNSNKTELKIDNSLYETTDDIAAAAAVAPPSSSSYSFNISKWSECSFETPFVPSSSTTSSVDSSFNKNDLRENMLKNSYLYNYKQPVAPTSNSNISGSGIIKNITIHQHQQQHQSTAASSLSLPADILIGATSTTGSSNNATTMNSSHQKKITLINHSINNSGFVEYSRIKSIFNNNVSLGPLSSFKSSSTSKKIIDNNYQCSSKRSSSSSIISSSPLSSSVSGSSATGNNDDENLLTSDRTHFRPIKQSYADGYVFDIPNNLDDVKFERSESGYLYFESEKYLEYTRSDSFLSDEDPVIFSSSSTSKAKAKALATSSSIKIVGKKSTATASTVAPLKSIINRKHKKGEFALKFRILQTEKYCQTENLIVAGKELNNVAAFIAANITKNKNDVNNKSKDMLIVENYNNCNDSSSESILLLDNSNSSNNSNENSSSNDTDYYLKNDESSVNLEQWSMAEIGKKCQNNNNTTHTLWGMCPACNKNSMKSLPANRLLKDELNVEADEIMSDLKYMQDLYIGSGGGGNGGDGDGSDWVENDDIDTDEDIDNDNEAGNCGDHDDDTDCDADMLKECELYETFVVETLMGDDDDDNMDDNDDDDDYDGDYDNNDNNKYNKNDNDNKLEQQQDHIYYDVTKFISDLLKPENAKSLANALGATTKNIYNKPPNMMASGNDDCCYDRENDNNNSIKIMNKNVNNEKYVGGLWSNNDENMIWTQQLQQQQQQQQQQKDEKIQQNSINEEFLMKLRKNSSTTSLSSSAATFLETFSNWKYSNLAELWKNTSTTSSSSTVSVSASNCGGSCNDIKNNEIISENNNIKNFQSFNDAFQKQQKLSSSLSNNQQQQEQQQQQQQQQLNTTISSSPQKSSNDDDIIFKIIKKLNDEHKNSTSTTSTTSSTTTTTTADNDGISQKFQKSKFITNRKRRHSASQSYNLTEMINNNNSITTTTTAADKCINNDFNLMMKCKNYFDYDNRKLITMKNDDTIKTKLYEFDFANNKTTKMNYIEKNSNKSPTETIITCKYWAKLTTAPTTEISTNQNDDDDVNVNVNDGNDDITMITSSFKGKSSYFSANNNKGNNSNNNNNNNGSHFDGFSTALVLNPSSILKQVAVVTRPLTR